MLSDNKLIETLADAVMNRPREFFIGDRRFCLYSPTLGMSLMLDRHISELGINCTLMSKNPSLEALRLATEQKDEVCYILSILTHRRFSELSNSNKLNHRAKFFADYLSTDELAQLALVALSDINADTLIEASGLGKERERQSEIAKFKNRDGHSATFGGKTMYGSLIGVACEKFGWTKEYVVWGIDLVSLRMMLADTINTVYLSDDDMKGLGRQSASHEKKVIGMSKEDIAALQAILKETQ